MCGDTFECFSFFGVASGEREGVSVGGVGGGGGRRKGCGDGRDWEDGNGREEDVEA